MQTLNKMCVKISSKIVLEKPSVLARLFLPILLGIITILANVCYVSSSTSANDEEMPYNNYQGSDPIKNLNPDANSGTEFTLVVLPDTQSYSMWYPEIYSMQTQWIINNRDELNIKFVIHVGDIVNNADMLYQWDNADSSMSILDGQIPYLVVPGNHDYLNNCDSTRDTTNYNYYFNYTRFDNYAWYGGHYADENENSYGFFSDGIYDFLVLGLEFCPRDEVLLWANDIINDHVDKKVIIFTHLYMNYDNTRLGTGDPYNCTIYGCGSTCNNGDDIWNELISNHLNILLVISGHAVGKLNGEDIGSTGRTTDYVSGQPIHQLLQNYQMESSGGNGWLRYYTFKPDENMIEVHTYSPYLDEYENSLQNHFDLIYSLDLDNDGILNHEDNCPDVYNPDQADIDNDGIGDVCDNCLNDYNPFQVDCDNDGAGDICDPDTIDLDGDGIDVACDNCPSVPNPTQEDSYPAGGNNCGDACECEGNFDIDNNVDGSDASVFKHSFGRNSGNRECTNDDPCKGDFSCDKDVDGSDASKFKSDFGRSGGNNPCPPCHTEPWCNY